jgi:hypothetical protein
MHCSSVLSGSCHLRVDPTPKEIDWRRFFQSEMYLAKEPTARNLAMVCGQLELLTADQKAEMPSAKFTRH